MKVTDYLRTAWSVLFEPPWRRGASDDVFLTAAQRGLETYPATNRWPIHNVPLVARGLHWLVWIVGWLWILAGLLFGAFIASVVTQPLGVANSPYRDHIAIGIAVLVTFIVQLVAWLMMLLADWSARGVQGPLRFRWSLLFAPAGFLLMLWPLGAIGVVLYRYLTWIGPGQREIAIAFVGGLLVKQLLFPVIVGIARGKAFMAFRAWLRGERPKGS